MTRFPPRGPALPDNTPRRNAFSQIETHTRHAADVVNLSGIADDLLHQRELPYHPQMVTEDDVRQVALSLPETAEKPYNRLPAFRVRSKLFIRIHELPDALLVRCADLEERNELLKAGPGKFFITPHYDGYPAVLVRLSQVDLDEVTELVTESWRLCASKRLLAAYDAKHPPAP